MNPNHRLKFAAWLMSWRRAASRKGCSPARLRSSEISARARGPVRTVTVTSPALQGPRSTVDEILRADST